MHILVIVGQFINVNGSRSSSVHMFVCVCVCVFLRESNHISSLALTVIAHASQQHWSRAFLHVAFSFDSSQAIMVAL